MVALNIILVLALLSLMIIVHELGHWIVARWLGFQTPVFGFGLPFGPSFKIGKWLDTEFKFHWFVLGGYVAIPELGDETSDDVIKEIHGLKPLKSFPVWKRAAVASAGVAFNILFAYLVCLIMVATIGPPSTKGNVVITSFLDSAQNAFGERPNQIAKLAGFNIGDEILQVNEIKIEEPSQVVRVVRLFPQKEVLFKIKRFFLVNGIKKDEVLKIHVTPNKEGRIGIAIGLARSGDYDKPSKNPLVWLVQSALVLAEWTVAMVMGLYLMVLNLFGISIAGAPKVSADDLHGIIAIISVFAQAITIDPREIYRWTALISVNLAIINLLPIPALDGGHLLFMFIEKIRGKRLADSFQQKAIQTGFFLLIVLMVFVFFNDIKGLISGKFHLIKEKVEMQGVKK